MLLVVVVICRNFVVRHDEHEGVASPAGLAGIVDVEALKYRAAAKRPGALSTYCSLLPG